MHQDQKLLNSPATRINKLFYQLFCQLVKRKRYIYRNEDYLKETLEIRKENWRTVKRLRSQGTYAYLVYDRIVTKGKYRKQQNE